jgi:hypothetical protein
MPAQLAHFKVVPYAIQHVTLGTQVSHSCAGKTAHQDGPTEVSSVQNQEHTETVLEASSPVEAAITIGVFGIKAAQLV